MSDNVAVEAQTSDPLKTVADAMEHAVQAARDGASDAKAKVDQALPAVNRFVSRFVYTTCYTRMDDTDLGLCRSGLLRI